MATDLTAEFEAGRLAYVEGVTDCPHYATSTAAEGWHAGRAYEQRRPSVYLADLVTAGRGGRVNVREGHGHPDPKRAPVTVYRVAWDKSGVSVSREARS